MDIDPSNLDAADTDVVNPPRRQGSLSTRLSSSTASPKHNPTKIPKNTI